jgi:hypothetical protein
MVWTVAQAAQRYLALAAPSGRLFAEWDALPQYSDQVSLKDARRVAAQLAAADEEFAQALLQPWWPDSARAQIGALALTAQQDSLVWKQIAAAHSSYAAYALYNNGGFENGTTAGNDAMVALGLLGK